MNTNICECLLAVLMHPDTHISLSSLTCTQYLMPLTYSNKKQVTISYKCDILKESLYCTEKEMTDFLLFLHIVIHFALFYYTRFIPVETNLIFFLFILIHFSFNAELIPVEMNWLFSSRKEFAFIPRNEFEYFPLMYIQLLSLLKYIHSSRNEIDSFPLIHNNSSLRKHAYSNILRILPPKNENFQMKKSDIFILLLKT